MTPINQKIAELSLQEAALRVPTIYIRGVKVTSIKELKFELKKLKEEEENGQVPTQNTSSDKHHK